MNMPAPVAAVTGASGYLGSQICSTLESEGWRVIRLTRSSGQSDGKAYSYDLATPVSAQVRDALRSVNTLIHTAYDLSLTSPADIWAVNVEGTRRLLEAAEEAGVSRVIVLSSMSAFAGTSQLYGRAKLDIEEMTIIHGGCALRPGLVHSERAGGMAGALRKLATLPIVPVIAGGAGVYTVREQDLMRVIAVLSSAAHLAPGTISAAHPSPVRIKDLIRTFAAQENRRCRFVPVPWQLVYWLLRSGEFIRLRLPFRADSVLGLIHTAPGLEGEEQLGQLGVTLHAFESEPAWGAAAPSGGH